jgi:YD repeat-containing protein
LDRIAQAGVGDLADFGYDLADRLVSAALGSEAQTEYNYDDNDRLIGLTHEKSEGPTLFDKSFGYDAAGNRLWSRDSLAGQGGLSELYGYDGLDP